MADLIPGQALIYESYNGVVYARYRDPPYNTMYDRWIIGGDPDAVNRATGNLFGWSEWQDMIRIAENNETLKKQIDKLLDIYYILKDDK